MPMVNLATCGRFVVREGKVVCCGEHASFIYQGLIMNKPGMTMAHSLERYGRGTTDLCMAHSRETFLRMEPALKTGEATMRCLEFTKLTLHCTRCRSLYRFEPLRPIMVKTAPEQSPNGAYFLEPSHFCPACGSPATAQFSPELDYWEIMAGALDLPVAIVVEAYGHWMKDRTATTQFVEYIQGLLAELDAADA